MELLFYQRDVNPLMFIPIIMITAAITWLIVLIACAIDDPLELKTRIISAITIPILLIVGIVGCIHVDKIPNTYVWARLTEPVNATEFYSKYEIVDQYEDILKLRVKGR